MRRCTARLTIGYAVGAGTPWDPARADILVLDTRTPQPVVARDRLLKSPTSHEDPNLKTSEKREGTWTPIYPPLRSCLALVPSNGQNRPQHHECGRAEDAPGPAPRSARSDSI